MVQVLSLLLLALLIFRRKSNLTGSIPTCIICCIDCLLVIEVFYPLRPLFMETSLVFLLILSTLLILSILPSLHSVNFPWRNALVIITIIVLGWFLCFLAMWLASIPIRMILLLLIL